MAKWVGTIGFAQQKEQEINGVPSGVWVEEIVTRKYTGDLVKHRMMSQNTNEINDGLNISNQISIIADPYALNNYVAMRYLTFMGVKWKIKDIDVEFPRMILSIGDMYNETEN